MHSNGHPFNVSQSRPDLLVGKSEILKHREERIARGRSAFVGRGSVTGPEFGKGANLS